MEPLRPVSTTEALVAALREQILAGELSPGARLPSEWLAARFGVARPTVRAAIQTLVSEGLLRRDRNRTAYVPRLEANDVQDLFYMRVGLELHAVRTLVERGVRPHAAEEALERPKADGMERSWIQALDDAISFHRGLIEAVESPRLAHAFANLEAEWALCLAQVEQPLGALAVHRNSEHREIFEAVVDRDAERATRLMREHLEGGASLSLGLE